MTLAGDNKGRKQPSAYDEKAAKQKKQHTAAASAKSNK